MGTKVLFMLLLLGAFVLWRYGPDVASVQPVNSSSDSDLAHLTDRNAPHEVHPPGSSTPDE